jgi:hypothetical protein
MHRVQRQAMANDPASIRRGAKLLEGQQRDSLREHTIMSDDAERRIRLLYKGNEVFRMLAKTVGKARNEMIVKPAEKGARLHYSLAGNQSGLSPHIKHEGRKGKPTYDKQPTISIAELIRMVGTAIAPEDDPLPEMIQGSDKENTAEINKWFKRAGPKVIHPPTSRRVHIPTKYGIELIDEMMKLEKRMKSSSDKDEIDITDIVSGLHRDRNEEKPTIIISEDEMLASGHSVVLSEDESRIIVLLDDNRVVEFSTEVLQVSEDLIRKMGLSEFFNQIREPRESRESE